MESTNTRLSDQIARTLQRLIHDRQLKPGDRLPSERALAEQLGVSRPPVREAIRTLAGQGLLTTRRGGGTYLQTDLVNWPETRIQPLAGLLQDDIHYRYDVLEARHTLESDTAWYAALRATQQDKDNIRRCLDDMLEQQAGGNAVLTARADARLHLAIAEASHNLVLVQIMRGLFDVLLSSIEKSLGAMFQPDAHGTIDELTLQHRSLVRAILEGDAERARDTIRHHLEFVQQTVRTREDDEARRRRAHRLSSSRTLS